MCRRCVGQTGVNNKGRTLPRTLNSHSCCWVWASLQRFKSAKVKVTFSCSLSTSCKCYFGRGKFQARGPHRTLLAARFEAAQDDTCSVHTVLVLQSQSAKSRICLISQWRLGCAWHRTRDWGILKGAIIYQKPCFPKGDYPLFHKARLEPLHGVAIRMWYSDNESITPILKVVTNRRGGGWVHYCNIFWS